MRPKGDRESRRNYRQRFCHVKPLVGIQVLASPTLPSRVYKPLLLRVISTRQEARSRIGERGGELASSDEIGDDSGSGQTHGKPCSARGAWRS